MQLSNKIEHIPKKPGVYIIRSNGVEIYVGKAKSLRDRVRSYLPSNSTSSAKTKALIEQMDDIEYIVTENSAEALILEENLIKEHRPRYNIQLKDNKSYPYVKITKEKFPKIELVRLREEKDEDGEYFGPYTQVTALRSTLRTIERLFPIRDCNWSPERGYRRPCLRYYIKECHAPCSGEISEEEYKKEVEKAKELLLGNSDKVIEELKRKMKEASEKKLYEKAAEWRDKIEAVRKLGKNQQKVRISDSRDQDYIALTKKESKGLIQLLFVRNGRISGADNVEITYPPGSNKPEILNGFISSFYSDKSTLPGQIYVCQEPEELETLVDMLSSLRESKVDISVPKRGEKRKVLEMAKRNASFNLREFTEEGDKEKIKAIKELKNLLGLDSLPYRIEGYDISNISGKDSVGSMVVFENGGPVKSDYRKFKIENTSGPDDYRMLQEVIRRRIKRLKRGEASEKSESFEKLPDLLLIDGGKGQLGAVSEVLAHFGVEEISIIALAKEYEEIFLPDRKKPLVLSPDSIALKLLQRVRNEAHRFAVSYHKKLRQKRTVRSSLDSIKGVGPVRKNKLLSSFGSVTRISKATLQELKDLDKIPDEVAERIHNFYR